MSKHQLVLCELADAGLPSHESFSPFCMKVHRALLAAGLPYLRRHGAQPTSHRKLNPTGQVPVLLTNGRPIADSTQILEHIRELAPGRLHADAEAWLWEELADTSLNGFLVAARWADERNWPRTRDAYFHEAPGFVRRLIVPRIRKQVIAGLHARDVWRAGAEHCWARFSTLLDSLDARAPQLGYWCGPSLSVADVALFAQLHSLRTPLTEWQHGELSRRKRLSAWLDRVHEETRCAAPIVSFASSSSCAVAS
jgi:glutathione S-transferase